MKKKSKGSFSVIEAVKERFNTVISLDTYKATVAKAGIQAGADLINDIWGAEMGWNNGRCYCGKAVYVPV